MHPTLGEPQTFHQHTRTMTKTLDVLCFGDSLTGGWTHGGQTKHPYSSVLKAYLNSAFAASDTKVSVYTNGVAGDVASWPAFKERLTNECTPRLFISPISPL